MEPVSDADLPRLRRNFSMIKKLTPESAALERKLQTTKWFDYRFISPLEATELFVEAYSSAYQYYFGKYFDTKSAQGKTGVRQRLWKSSLREFTSFWRARQFADELGVPYDQFVDGVFHACGRRNWSRLPRPNQIYGAKFAPAVKDRVIRQWREWTEEAKLMFSRLPQYRNEHFVGLPAQVSHRDWVVSQLKVRHGDHEKIAELCFVQEVLPIDRAIAEFGDEQFERAKRYATDRGLAATPVAPLSVAETRPSCFGLLNGPDAAATECIGCPLQVPCSGATAFVKAQAIEKIGSDDPRAERRRQQGRDRVRRHRAKAKAAAHPSSLKFIASLGPRSPSRGV
jgi:hypothetical protein